MKLPGRGGEGRGEFQKSSIFFGRRRWVAARWEGPSPAASPDRPDRPRCPRRGVFPRGGWRQGEEGREKEEREGRWDAPRYGLHYAALKALQEALQEALCGQD